MPGRRAVGVAFQGEAGAFSWTAARKFFGERVRDVARASFAETFEALRDGEADYAVLPIENTLYGSIHENYDHLLAFGFPIVAETAVRIEHNLIVVPGTRLKAVRRAFSHPVALGQCRTFFERHPSIEPASFYDTAGSVKMLLAERLPEAGAIASAAAASLYGGEIVKANIEDNRQNFTRFFLLAKQETKSGRGADPWKTSLVFAAPNVPGILFKALACFALRDLSLTKIESRPLRDKPWEYLFYIDTLGHSQSIPVKNALTNLKECATFVKLLGSYRAVD